MQPFFDELDPDARLVARRFNQVNALGKFLDPMVDKLLISSTLLVLVARGLALVISLFRCRLEKKRSLK